MKPIPGFNIFALVVGIFALFSPLWFVGLAIVILSSILIIAERYF